MADSNRVINKMHVANRFRLMFGQPQIPDKSASFDGVHRQPMDRVAGVMFSKGIKAPEPKMGTMTHWEVCPPIHTQRMVREIHRSSGEDLTGRRCGRMVVAGFSSEIPARWIMRCDCGDYEPRTAKAIKNPNNVEEGCAKCRQLAQSKRNHEFHTTGRNTPDPSRMNAGVLAHADEKLTDQ